MRVNLAGRCRTVEPDERRRRQSEQIVRRCVARIWPVKKKNEASDTTAVATTRQALMIAEGVGWLRRKMTSGHGNSMAR